MADWYAKPLGDGMSASFPLADIEKAFAVAFEAAGRPRDMLLLKRHATGSGLYCEVTALFSPAAAELARQYGATPCPAPDPDDVRFVAGAADWREACFPALRRG